MIRHGARIVVPAGHLTTAPNGCPRCAAAPGQLHLDACPDRPGRSVTVVDLPQCVGHFTAAHGWTPRWVTNA